MVARKRGSLKPARRPVAFQNLKEDDRTYHLGKSIRITPSVVLDTVPPDPW